ncbi:hypothetical protein JAAARDRAFT_294108 [Jaapia argillacea MUCL 33604]|uniref:Uncharacterized protein n=1 Tax=Jaapia argillacea MUCL 33604 TaxID=933084 RepID=A0A067PNY7_9AGAM|nr:hypothetical protein JAAARDRAFT_294108 [Jaapia argillacea MUCL 33604]
MARRVKDLGPDCQVDDESKKVCCLVCKAAHPSGLSVWIARASWARHKGSPNHQDAVAFRENLEHEATKACERFEHHSKSAPVSLPTVLTHIVLPTIPHFGVPIGEDCNGISGANFDFTPEEEALYFPGIPTPEIAEKEQERLRREVERMMVEAIEDDLEGLDKDVTVSNIAHEMRNLGLEADEGDEEDLHAYLHGVAIDHDFAPYPTKTMFLLDVLDNLPRL